MKMQHLGLNELEIVLDDGFCLWIIRIMLLLAPSRRQRAHITGNVKSFLVCGYKGRGFGRGACPRQHEAGVPSAAKHCCQRFAVEFCSPNGFRWKALDKL